MGLLDDEELLRRPAFGVFPQMQPRRRFQDREASANVPVDATRGRFAGLLGLLPDALNFMGRSPMPTEMFGETQYEPTPQMPYGSEYYLKNLPLKPTSRIGEVAGQAGAFVPLNPMPAARAVAAGARALGPTAVGMGERYLQRQGLMPAVVPETPGLLGSIEKPQAPVSELGFYSAAEQAALNIPRKSGTGESFLNDLMKGQDVKKDELSWMGLDDYLKGKPNVTRQEVQDFISANRVDVREVRLGDKEVKLPSTIGLMKREEILNKYQPKLDALYAEDANYANLTPQRYEELGQEIRALERQRDVEADAAYVIPPLPQLTPTKFQQYQLPGGENYREILLTLPFKEPPMPRGYGVSSVQYEDGTRKYFAETPTSRSQGFKTQEEAQSELVKTAANLKGFRQNLEAYKSSHFNEPNILAHMRVNDRVDADGKKMLLIEEIQSDWHQAGREKGYKTKARKVTEEQKQEFKKLNAIDDGDRTGQMNERLDELESLIAGESQGVPDAPFKDTWHQLALKRALKYAADNGYDRVGLTTGSQQAKRYDLSKQVDEIVVPMVNSDGSRSVRIEPTEGGNIKLMVDSNGVVTGYGSGSTQFSGKKLNEVLGKEIADKVMNAQANAKFSGLDLQVGGEGMKKYYDEIYPAFLAKQGKKYNAKTGETRIKTGNAYAQTKGIPAEQSIRYIDISPEMRGGVKKGQPLFTAAPIGGIGLGAGTQDNEMPDAVRQYMANPAPGLLQDEEERKKLGGLLFR